MRNLNIVFLHGWLFDSKVWHDIKKFFHKKHSIKIYDLPGYGANKTLNMEHQKYCDKIFLNANRPTIVIGFSYGGLLALKSYLSLDSYIEKIFLINTNLNIKQRSGAFLSIENISKLKNNLLFYKDKTIENFIYEVTRNSKYLKQELKILNRIYTDSCWPSNDELIKNLEYMARFEHNIKDTQKDIVLINSENDIFNDFEYIKTLSNKHIQKKIIKDVGHLPFISRNKEIYHLIESLI